MRKSILGLIAFVGLLLAPLVTAAAPTQYACAKVAGVWQCDVVPYGKAGGVWQTPKGAYAKVGGVWQPFYSTPTVSASSVSGSGSGSSSSGTVTTGTPGTTPGGYYQTPGSYSWSCLSGTCATISSGSAQNPTWSYSFSGVGCNSSSSISGTWNVTFTDAIGWAASQNITVGNLTWTNTQPCFTPHTDTFTSGSGSDTVPSGASSLTIRRVGPGGTGGDGGFVVSSGDSPGGGGGGSGGYAAQTIAISPSDWGASISYVVGVTNSSDTSTTGSLANGSVSATATRGGDGGNGGSTAGAHGTGGAAGTPGGNAGAIGVTNVGGAGGAAPYSTYGKGGDGSGTNGPAPGNQTGGAAIFEWS